MPPVLDVSLAELMRRAQEQMLGSMAMCGVLVCLV
jgi:hypothetical protein